jgi:hypothetical protein
VIYTFYPCRKDGSSIAFDAAELADDAAAQAYALTMLTRHASAVEVVIWAGERRAGSVARASHELA